MSRLPRIPLSGSLVLLLQLVSVGLLVPDPALAQKGLPPEKGGLTYELGMPPVYKGRSGFEMGWYRPQTKSELNGFYNLGLSRSLGSPVIGIAALRLEGYLGVSSQAFDGGGRALFEIPIFHVGVGADFNGTDSVIDALYTLDLPIHRGGLFGRGTTLAIRWLPSRDQTFSVGVNVPLWGSNIGATRPKRDHVRLITRDPKRVDISGAEVEGELTRTLDELRERAGWVCRLSQPFVEHSGADPHAAMAPAIAELTAHIDSTSSRFPRGHTFPEEIRVYHETLDRAFTIAAGEDAELGARISRQGRAILMDDVLIPYNFLLGQRKTDDSLIGLIATAQSEFAGWVLTELDLPRDTNQRIFYVYQTLCDIMEERRQVLRERWEDSRLVWMPLQLTLTPDQHDTQEELDAIIARATGQDVTRENHVWYVINEEFQWEMARSVREAEYYHVLWIHDFRGRNGDGDPDAVAFAHTLNYLETFIDRVEAYDDVGRMPQYFIFLDQHYFELNKARLFLRVLLDPLDQELSLPKGYEDWEQQLRSAQARLRTAVDRSMLLRVGESQYGRKWLKNQLKVHVNITNPADPSFWSWHVAGIIPIPDNLMRDHRKIAFYDITEEDPYRGIAMFTGMGIGEHYVGANWEDRAVMIQGPGALEVKNSARRLLLAQGYDAYEIPFPLRDREKPAAYQAMLDDDHAARTPDWMDERGGVLQLHNETGYHDKPINVSKAVLYSLMPAGSVLEVPDSLWQSYVYASLLAGSALRGCHVLVIAPTADSAPSAAATTLARAHGMLGRLVVFSADLDRFIADQGGILKVGLYQPQQGVADIEGRFAQVEANVPSWMRRVYPANPAVRELIESVPAILDSLDYEVAYLTDEKEVPRPKIHLKANFFASRTAWEALLTRPELAEVLREYVAYLARQTGTRPDDGTTPSVRDIPEQLAAARMELARNLTADLTPAQRDELVYYFTVGSTNMDYRSMIMDGEVQVLMGGWQALSGFLDFLLLPGLCEWVETTEDLDALLPPPGGMTRTMGGLLKLLY